MPMESLEHLRKGDMVRVVWKDACEGSDSNDLQRLAKRRLTEFISALFSTTGRYLRTIDDYMILRDVLYEESEGKVFYEKQASGKWLSIPISAIVKVVQVKEASDQRIREARRRRIIFRQLRLIPRARRLSSGEITRTLYIS